MDHFSSSKWLKQILVNFYKQVKGPKNTRFGLIQNGK